MKPLLQPFRRWLAPAMVAMLALPSVGMLFAQARTRSILENRMLAASPAWPADLGGWRALPGRVDAYLKDHYAFRPYLTAQGNQLRWRLGGQLGGGAVVRGQGAWLFLRDNLLEVTGGQVRRGAAADYASFVCDVDQRLKARSIPMLFAMAPSPAAIYPESLPAWVPRGRPDAYDLILEGAAACGARTVDLRPALVAAKPGGSVYYHRDTHWSEKGALIAYNVLVGALGRADWRLPLDRLVWRRAPEDHADLVNMSGAGDLRPLSMAIPDLDRLEAGSSRAPIAGVQDGGHPAFVESTGRAGPTVLVIGDSYSADFMPPYFAAHVGRFAWAHHQWCGFDWKLFDVVRPDMVILIPADRSAACARGAHPLNMPAA